MLAEWTGEIVKKMHIYGISAKQLAEEAKIHPKYLSMILNGHRTPKNAESKLNAVLDRLIAGRHC